jgi:Cu(I)/Ag(I) efflux system membrane fusion protein
MAKRNTIIIALLVMTIPALYLLYQRFPFFSSDTRNAAPSALGSQAAQKKIFICPMHPEISQDHPGTCPICGMKLVEAGGHEAHEHGIQVDSATIQRLGIRLASVRKDGIGQDLKAYGSIVADERALYNVHPRYDGWIKKLYIHSVGERIKEGQVLYEIYSPDLIARERAYLTGVDRRKQVLQTINTTPDTENEYVMDLATDAARDRAKLHTEEGVSVETIQFMEDNRQVVDVAKIVSDHAGVVTQLNAREGAFISATTTILTLADVAKAWVDVPLYPDQAALVSTGDPVTIHTSDGQAIHAKLDFISPLAENNKARARVYLDNTKYHLRPGAFVDVTIGVRTHQALVLPRSAILYAAQGNMVMLSRGDGRFLPVPVETGVEEGDQVEIVSGLREGAEVAVNGQFLLDAASSMSADAERMHMQQP